MSWDKNTINCSDMDAIIRTLDNNGISYTLSLLGAVKAMGINDEHNGIQSYPIRKLEYKNVVVLEQINRTSDCDLHDYIHAYEFQKGEEPENWKIETVDSENENWAGDIGLEIKRLWDLREERMTKKKKKKKNEN